MGAQRESRLRSGGGRVLRRRTQYGVYEARRRQRRGGPDVHRGLYGRERRAGHSRGGRPRNAQLPERAGHQILRPQRAHPDARTFGQRRGKGIHEARLRFVRKIRYSRVCPHHHEACAFAEFRGRGGEGGSAPPSLCQGREQIYDDAFFRNRQTRCGGSARRQTRGGRQRFRHQPRGDEGQGARRRLQRRCVRIRARSAARCVRAQIGYGLSSRD